MGTNSGSAYVFTRSTGVWTQQQKLIAIDGASGDEFGWSVAIDGDTTVIGAPGDDDIGSNTGSVYVFVRTTGVSIKPVLAVPGELALLRTAGVWIQQHKLIVNEGAQDDQFGWSVAVDGNTAVIGARSDNDYYGSASAYVFTRTTNAWTQQQKLTAGAGGSCDSFPYNPYYFRFSVAVDGDTAIIGTPRDDDCFLGSAYVFTRTADAWMLQQKLSASDGASYDYFGYSVAVDGDTAVISAPQDSDNGTHSGSAYVFARSAGVWTQTLKLLASDGQSGDLLGYYISGVGVSGSTVVAGASSHDSLLYTNSGAAYVFSAIPDVEGPITSNVLVNPNQVAEYTPLEIAAKVDDTTTGGGSIASVSYTLDGGEGIAMVPTDGGFDEVMEEVGATIAFGLPGGIYNVCVFGTDVAGNTGVESCTVLSIYYTPPDPPSNLSNQSVQHDR